MNVLSDGYVAGIVAHLSKDELARYDAEHGGRHPELAAASGAADSQGEPSTFSGLKIDSPK